MLLPVLVLAEQLMALLHSESLDAVGCFPLMVLGALS